MKNRKGFTLVELLAMLVVLGILMGVAIPNISGILANNKLNVMKADASKMADSAKMKFLRLSKDEKPGPNQCVIFALNYLNDSDDIKNGPNGGEYLMFDSFVIVKKTRNATEGVNQFDYYIRLIERKDSNYLGINYIERSELSEGRDEVLSSVKSTDIIGLTGDQQNDFELLIANRKVQEICGGVKEYYPGKVLS